MVARESPRRVVLGRIGAPHGVLGGIRVHSYTEPVEDILHYPRWQLRRREGWHVYRLLEGSVHGRGLVVRLAPGEGEEIADRETAGRLSGLEVAVWRSEMEPPAPGEYYWVDLLGLRVHTLAGDDLGTVARVFETGANDVLVVQGERERLVPFLRDRVIHEVNLESGLIRVDWDPSF